MMKKLKLTTTNSAGKPCYPSISPIPGTGKMRLDHNIIYRIEYDCRKYRYLIKGGFEFDGGSIPAIARPIVTPFAPYGIRGFLLHDFLFRFNPGNIGRKIADIWLRLILLIDKAGSVRASTVATGLCFGSWYSWNEWRKKDKPRAIGNI